MARHRNVRGMNYDEEYEGYFDVYGHSVPDDDYCISPSTAEQFLYRRDSGGNRCVSHSMSTEADIKEEDEGESAQPTKNEYLSQTDLIRMQSCLIEMHNIVGETVPDATLKEAILEHNFDMEKALDDILTKKASQQLKVDKGVSNEAVIANSSKIKTEVKNRESKPSIPKVNIETCAPKNVKKSFPSNRTPVSGFDVTDDRCRSAGTTPKSSRNNSRERLLNSDKPSRDSSGSRNENNRGKDKSKLISSYNKERSGGKELINMVVIGHVDAGKSTLMGHLLFRLGCVNKKTMHKYEQESKKLGKSSFAYAWVLDETGEERSRGITMDIAQSRFETENKIVNLLDAPGHKDFIPNMITGAAQADVAILVVDATRGEFETGFESGGQTREHAILVRSLGISQLTVAVNKLDNVDWSKDRFSEIVEKLGSFLKQVGYKDVDVVYIPCSGLTGENISQGPKDENFKLWYNGPTLLQQIDLFSAPDRPISKPLRLTVSDVFKGPTGGFCISGLIDTGCIQTSDKVLIMPSAEQAVIKSMTLDDAPVTEAFAGDQVILNVSGIDMNNVSAGNFVCDFREPIKVASMIRARIVIFNISVPLTKGFPVIFHYKSLTEQAVIKKLNSVLNKSSGEVAKKKPRCLTKNSNAEIEIMINRPVCIEVYKDFKELGRFMLRYGGSTIAAGLVTQIIS